VSGYSGIAGFTSFVQVVLTTDITISAVALTNIAGLSTSMEVSAIYAFEAVLVYSTSVGVPVRFGMTFPAMVDASGKINTGLTIQGASVTQSTVNAGFGWWNETLSGTTMLSLASPAVAGNMAVMYKGTFAVSNAAGTLQLQSFASSGTDRIVFLRGSYMRVYRIA
jgi:hypothetical protein